MSVINIKAEPTTVQVLERTLEEAKAGSIKSVAIAGVLNDGDSFNVFSAHHDPIATIAELRILERDIIDLYVDTRRKVAWEFVE